MENKIFRKTISIDHVKWGFDPKMVLHFYFHYKPFPSQTRKERDRERERRESYRSTRSHPSIGVAIYLAPPLRSHYHWRPIHPDRSHPDRSQPTEIASPQIHPPKTDLIGAVITHDRSHHPLVITHHLDQSLPFPPFLITLSSSLSQFDWMVEFNE